jgi:hypothetical protein
VRFWNLEFRLISSKFKVHRNSEFYRYFFELKTLESNQATIFGISPGGTGLFSSFHSENGLGVVLQRKPSSHFWNLGFRLISSQFKVHRNSVFYRYFLELKTLESKHFWNLEPTRGGHVWDLEFPVGLD